MKKYFLHNGNEQQGPFDIDDLKSKDIQKDTPIWYEGLSNWTTAEKIDELKQILQISTPPPFVGKERLPPPIAKGNLQTSETKTPGTKKSKSGKTVSIVIGLLIVIAIAIAINNSTKNRRTQNTGSDSYKEKVMTVEEIERSNPRRFLDASGTYSPSFWGDKVNIKGVVINNATVAKYKDVVIAVTFYSNTSSVITTENYVIYDYFPAQSTKNFELKLKNYKGMKSLGWEAISAKAY